MAVGRTAATTTFATLPCHQLVHGRHDKFSARQRNAKKIDLSVGPNIRPIFSYFTT
jgi:hypothetical protein